MQNKEQAIENHKQFMSCSAEVLRRRFGADDPRADELEQKFAEMNRSSLCRELKGGLTGKPLRSCRGCVTDAAELLEQMLADAEE